MFDVSIAVARPQQLPGNAEAVGALFGRAGVTGAETPLQATYAAELNKGLRRHVGLVYLPWLVEYRKHRKASPFPLAFVQLTEAAFKALNRFTPGAPDSYEDVAALYAARVIVLRVLLLAEVVNANAFRAEGEAEKPPVKFHVVNGEWVPVDASR